MYVGRPRIMLRDRSGNPTDAGKAWLDMGGADPARYPGAIQSTEKTKYVMEGGRRHVLQKRVGSTDPEWRLSAKGKLRFREQNEWEVMIPAVLHRKDK